MNRTRKIKITELNPHVICVLCGGYYINATTITECLHSFCRTCITRYLETSKYCPVCDVMVHKTRPLEYIRSDKTLQDLVYKLVPGLYKMEMKRRREYYSKHDSSGVAHPPSEDRGDEFYDRIIYTEDEKISLSLELCAEGVPFKTPSTIHGHTGPENIKIKDVRYLQCPAAFSVGNIKKFIRMKFDLKQKYEIDVFHTAEPLLDYYTLMDIAYIYTWTRRAPLRLYYTVYVCRERPRATETITRQHPLTLSDRNVIEVNPVNSEKCVDILRENQEVKSAKRKFPDGPGDISPDLELEKKRPSSNESKRKESGVPRKRAKKQVVFDSSVLEAMSESEEQLAKLTLGEDDEGAKTDKEKKIATDSAECAGVNKPDEDGSDSFTEKKTDGATVSNDGRTGKEFSALKSVDHITLSQFQPLNVSAKDKKVTNGCVYEFANENSETSEICKAKGKPGKRKKINDSIKELSNNASAAVKSNKSLGAKVEKMNSPKKSQTINQDQSGNKIVKKKGRPPGKKNVNSSSDDKTTVERVKRKYVRKAVKTDDGNPKVSHKGGGKTAKSDKKQSDELHGKGNKTCANGENTKEVCNSSGALNDVDKTDSGPVHAKNEVVEDITEADSVKNTVENKTEMTTNSTEGVREPTTPLYGQTPKVMEETQGLPVSPNPDCAESGVINNGASCDMGNDLQSVSVKNVNKTNDLTKCSYKSVSQGEACGNGFNSGGLNGHGLAVMASSVTSSHLPPVAFSGYNSCDSVSGNSNGFTRSVVQANMASFNDNLTTIPPMSPPGVCVMASYQRLTDPHTGHPLTNGYSAIDQNSDQPLDLTNNGHREEYTKGKIFKTKLLKKNYPKTDNVANQKDKTNSQSANGLISSPWL